MAAGRLLFQEDDFNPNAEETKEAYDGVKWRGPFFQEAWPYSHMCGKCYRELTAEAQNATVLVENGTETSPTYDSNYATF